MRLGDHLAILRRLAGAGVYPPEFAWMLTLPVRRLILSPATLADRHYVMERGRVVDVIPNARLAASMDKLHDYLGV